MFMTVKVHAKTSNEFASGGLPAGLDRGIDPLLSSEYIVQAMASWRLLFMQIIPCASFFELARVGSSSAAKIAMMAMTTRSSIKVKPDGDEAVRPRAKLKRLLILIMSSSNSTIFGRPAIPPHIGG